MLRPDGAHLFIGGKLPPRGFAARFGEGGFFFRRQKQPQLIVAGQFQHHAGNVILHFRRQRPRRLDSLLEQFRHVVTIREDGRYKDAFYSARELRKKKVLLKQRYNGELET